MNPLKQIISMLQKSDNIKIGRIVSKKDDRCVVQTADESYITAWGNFNIGNNVYVKDGQILGRVKREGYMNIMVD